MPLVIDAHAHGTHMLPRPVHLVRRAISRGLPPSESFEALTEGGVDAAVACAVGDRLVTRFRWPKSQWEAVRDQLVRLRRDAEETGCRIAVSTTELAAAREAGRRSVVLGLEGGDVLGEDSTTRLDELYAAGVRVIGLVHFEDNALGTIAMTWKGAASSEAVRSGDRAAGLTPLGADVVRAMNAKGMLIDVAHADPATAQGICETTTDPVICSHTGARALHDFPRYLGDDEVRWIADTGGLIGLWPFHHEGKGVADADDFARHAAHLAGIAGPDHLCIGTDMNGVPGLMEGYRGERDFQQLVDALRTTGFDDEEVAGIAGGNLARVLAKVCA